MFSTNSDIELIAKLWDGIDPHSLPVPESHRRVLDEALRDYANDPDAGDANLGREFLTVGG